MNKLQWGHDLSTVETDLGEYKEGSRKAEQAKKRIQDLQPKMAAAQRAYRLASMKAVRIRLLLDVEKNARGKD